MPKVIPPKGKGKSKGKKGVKQSSEEGHAEQKQKLEEHVPQVVAPKGKGKSKGKGKKGGGQSPEVDQEDLKQNHDEAAKGVGRKGGGWNGKKQSTNEEWKETPKTNRWSKGGMSGWKEDQSDQEENEASRTKELTKEELVQRVKDF